MTSLSATAMVHKGEALLQEGDHHAGIAILEEVKTKFETANRSKANRARAASQLHIKKLSADPRIALGVGPLATRKEIKKKYRKLALKYHPDKNQFTEDLFKIIQTAYDQIKDKATPMKAPMPKQSHYSTHSKYPSTKPKSNYQSHYRANQRSDYGENSRGANQYYSHSEYSRKEAQRQYEKYKEQQAKKSRAKRPQKPSKERPAHHRSNAGKHKHHRHRKRRESGEHPSSFDKENAGRNYRKSRQSGKHEKKHSSRPQPDVPTAKAAEAEMNDFWNGGGKKFPFKFCREHPKEAADMFARMFKKNGSCKDMPSYENATYEAFAAAFEKRGYGQTRKRTEVKPDPGPSAPVPVQNLRALKGQIRADSVALMWKAVQGAVCYELFYRRTRDKSWTSSSNTLRTSACRKNNLLPGTHYDFRVRAKTTHGWGPTSATVTVRTVSLVPSAPLMRDGHSVDGASLHIRWTEAAHNGAQVEGYELQWRHWGAKQWYTASTMILGTECKKKNLLPGRRYQFRVRAKNRVGFGPYSSPIGVSTAKETATTSSDKKVSSQRSEQRAKPQKEPPKRAPRRPKPSCPPPAMSPTFRRSTKATRPRSAPSTRKAKDVSEGVSENFPPPQFSDVDLWYQMHDINGNEYWWSEITGSVWDGPTWIDRWDESHQAHYYENRETGHATWRKPASFIPIIPGSTN